MTGIASENSNRASDERFPVLLVEDADIISGAVVDMAPFIHPSLDFIIARNRDEVAQVLLDRGDIHVVFLDYNLDN